MIMRWLHNILKGASLTTALFIFQACYGTPSWMNDLNVELQVVSAEDGSPIDDVEIYSRIDADDELIWNLCGYTDEKGSLSTMIITHDGIDPQFRISDPAGRYAAKDTVVSNLGDTIVIALGKAE